MELMCPKYETPTCLYRLLRLQYRLKYSDTQAIASNMSSTYLYISQKSTHVPSYQPNVHFLHSITIYMLHCNPQHVSSSTLLIFRRTNCIITASGIVTLCKRPYSMPVESGILYGRLQRVTIPDAVKIQFVLLKMSTVLLETCRGL